MARVRGLPQCRRITPPDCRGLNHRPAVARRKPATPGHSIARGPRPMMPRRHIQAQRGGETFTSVRPAGDTKRHSAIPSRRRTSRSLWNSQNNKGCARILLARTPLRRLESRARLHHMRDCKGRTPDCPRTTSRLT
jgi:hypothetical protein